LGGRVNQYPSIGKRQLVLATLMNPPIAMTGVTKHLGFITTMSMTYRQPFIVARR
jgi:hypothetical protein